MQKVCDEYNKKIKERKNSKMLCQAIMETEAKGKIWVPYTLFLYVSLMVSSRILE